MQLLCLYMPMKGVSHQKRCCRVPTASNNGGLCAGTENGDFYNKLCPFLNDETDMWVGVRDKEKKQKMDKPRTTHDSTVIEKLVCETWRNSQWIVVWVSGWKLEKPVCVTKHDIWVVLSRVQLWVCVCHYRIMRWGVSIRPNLYLRLPQGWYALYR